VSVLYAAAMAGLFAAPLAAWRTARAAAALTALAALALGVVGGAAAAGGPRPALDLGGWLGYGSESLRADGLAGLFLLLTGLTGAATALAYMQPSPGRWLTALHAALVAFVALAVGAGNGFLLFLAWEALAVIILLTASADRERPGALLAGYLTGGLTKIGGGALLAAVALLYARTGSYSVAAWTHADLSPATRGVLFALLVAAFATKVGVIPLQGAVPVGYAAAPRGGAASLSVALAAGFYGLWRFVVEVVGPAPLWCGEALLVLGALTAVGGILYALTQDDMRAFLGWSTVEHTGIVLTGLGVALLGQSAGDARLTAVGLLAATLHLYAHGVAKTLALICVDRITVATGERGMDRLGGLMRRLAVSATGLGLATLTLAAIPPLGGFVSEWFTFQALLQGFRMPTLLAQLLCALAAATLALTAGLGLLAFAKLFGFVQLGPSRGRLPHAEGFRLGHLGVGLLVVPALVLGAVAPWEVHLLGSGLAETIGFDPADSVMSHPLVLGPVFPDFSVLAPTWLAVVLPAFALAALGVSWAGHGRGRGARRAPVWVGGSRADPAAVQYRPSSYVNPMRVVLRGPLGYRTSLEPIGEGDEVLVLRSRVVLAVDRFLYRPVAGGIGLLAGRVRRLQSGSLSAYLLYMLVVLIVILALIPALH
jgi:formate hydrogenlyase subunit 3/multisubunit Na+/H+ antiporter MnhD subunit